MSLLLFFEHWITMAEKYCNNKFDEDMMLIFGNFSDEARIEVIEFIKEHLKRALKIGMVFDKKMIEMFCSMYLGLSWSMYRKGRLIEKEGKLIENISKNIVKVKMKEEKKYKAVESYMTSNQIYMNAIKDITIRYYTLYFSTHIEDMFSRMEVSSHPSILSKDDLRNFVLGNLEKLAIKIVVKGIMDEHINYINEEKN